MQLRGMQNCYKEGIDMLIKEELGYFVFMNEIEHSNLEMEQIEENEELTTEMISNSNVYISSKKEAVTKR